jgi:SH3-like domain-containing protein
MWTKSSNGRAAVALRGLILSCAVLFMAAGAAAHAQTATDAAEASPGSSKAPRYLSLKSDRVALRQGPGTEFPTAWVFRRAGLPVEIIRENGSWHEVRDASGTVGWVHGSLLSRRRTALVLPWGAKEGQPHEAAAIIREDDRAGAQPIAQIEAGALVSIITCESGWCRISIGGFRGYVEQTKLWGTYPNELIK